MQHDDDEYSNPINFRPNPLDAKLIRELHAQLGLRGATLLRFALTQLGGLGAVIKPLPRMRRRAKRVGRK